MKCHRQATRNENRLAYIIPPSSWVQSFFLRTARDRSIFSTRNCSVGHCWGLSRHVNIISSRSLRVIVIVYIGSSVFILHVAEVFVATSVYLHWQLPLPALCLRCRLLTTANAYTIYHIIIGHFFTMQNAGEFPHQPFGNCQFPTSVLLFFSYGPSWTSNIHVRIVWMWKSTAYRNNDLALDKCRG